MPRRERMNEDTLAALVDGQITDARQFATSDLIEGRDKALEYVRGEVTDIPAEKNKSSVTSRDLSDHLNWIMPGLLRVFLASDKVAVYEPNKQEMGQDETGKVVDLAEQRAAQATDYLNYVFLSECAGYRVLSSAFYDGLLLGNGIVKHWWDDTDQYKTERFTGLTEDEWLLLGSHPDVEEILEHSERMEAQEPAALTPMVGNVGPEAGLRLDAPADAAGPAPTDGVGMPGTIPQAPAAPSSAPGMGVVPALPSQPTVLHDCKIKRKVSGGRLRVEALPPEEFLIERNAKALDETVRFCAHYYQATRSELIERGYSRERVEDMASGSSTTGFDTANQSRDGTYLPPTNTDGPDRSTELVDVYECYVLCDYDGDGLAERRRVVMAGGVGQLHIVENEEWDDDLPFSDLVPEPVPHRWKGRTLYDELQDVMRVKTVLMRQTLDNLYMTNNPMKLVRAGAVSNMDALNNRTIGANVLCDNVETAVKTEVYDFTADKSFAMLEYWDQTAEKRTGVGRSSMGLDPDALQNQTAEAVRDQRSASATKTEAYARNIAENGLKRMFRCLLKLITAHQDKARTIRLRGKWVKMDPTAWDPEMDVTINTGLGTGSRDRDLMMLQGIAAKQELLIQTLGLAKATKLKCGLDKLFETYRKMAEIGGVRAPEVHFPELGEDDIAAVMSEESQQPDPKMEEVKAKLQLEQAKADHDAQLKQAQAAADLQHRQQELQAKAEFDREKAGADLQMLRDKTAAEIETMRERNGLEMQLAREKAQQDAELKVQELHLEAQLKREEMQMQAELARTQSLAQTNIQEARPQ